jgi:hypothetical protein
MKTIHEPARETSVAGACDVLVAGGGPAGFAAAVCAARAGAKVILIEQAGAVGGVATSGLMSHWTGRTRGGFYEEILDRSMAARTDPETRDPSTRWIINPEELKWVMLQMLREAGVQVQLYTFAAGPILEGRAVRGIFTESKSGREAWLAGVVVDATGDGDIAAAAGVSFRKGREADGRMQPMTLMFKVGGVDTARAIFPGSFESHVNVPSGEIQALARQHLPPPAGHTLLYRTTLPGVVTCNMTNIIEVDGTRAGDLTRAEYTCRGQIPAIVDFLRRFAPGYEQCYLLTSAAMVGVRETRHFAAEYALTEEDILAARVFPDWIATQAHFNFDIHSLKGAGLDEHGEQAKFQQQQGYTIPYRCLLPQGVENLLLAGRDIAGTHKAHSNYRVMPICANVGQGAGIAAALAAKRGVSPRQVPAADIQAVLQAQGVAME